MPLRPKLPLTRKQLKLRKSRQRQTPRPLKKLPKSRRNKRLLRRKRPNRKIRRRPLHLLKSKRSIKRRLPLRPR